MTVPMANFQLIIADRSCFESPVKTSPSRHGLGKIVGKVGAYEHFPRPSCHRFRCHIGIGDFAIGANCHHRVQTGFNQSACVETGYPRCFRFNQQLFHVPALGNVANHPDHAQGLPVGVKGEFT